MKIKLRWGLFTTQDFDALEEHMDELPRLLRRAYGYSRGRAEREAARFMSQLHTDELEEERMESEGGHGGGDSLAR
jgi:hypothetical protein